MASDLGPHPGGDEQEVLRSHGYHRMDVARVVQETSDARSFVLDVPAPLKETFRYRAGQFCTFRVTVGGIEHYRSYSMSSAPETDPDLTVTVKRVPGGLVSGWFLDEVGEGTELHVSRPAGVFCLQDRPGPVVAFCGGSGITPVMSILKSTMASTDRSVLLVYANRDAGSVIFAPALDVLRSRHPDRLEVHHHLDSESGFLDRAGVDRLAAEAGEADYYICGPAPFMDLVESALLGRGVDPGRIFIERFLTPAPTSPRSDPATASTPQTVTVVMKGRKTQIGYQPGDTLLETARRASLNPPFSCESGTCATCMAILRDGSARMRVNDALTSEEVEAGWILTCQAVPTSPTVTVEYESL